VDRKSGSKGLPISAIKNRKKRGGTGIFFHAQRKNYPDLKTKKKRKRGEIVERILSACPPTSVIAEKGREPPARQEGEAPPQPEKREWPTRKKTRSPAQASGHREKGKEKTEGEAEPLYQGEKKCRAI